MCYVRIGLLLMKAVIMVRISSKEQRDGHSIDAQTRNLELYASRKGQSEAGTKHIT